MELNTLLQVFGPAGVAFFIMWLWLQSIQKEKSQIVQELKEEKSARVKELKEIIPLLTETSRGLHDVISSLEDNFTESRAVIIRVITLHIDDKLKEIHEICNNKD